jgi:hypothetical protein
MFLELETECMRVYRRKVDSANAERAQLRQSLMAKEAEVKALVASIGENTPRFKVCYVMINNFASFSSIETMNLEGSVMDPVIMCFNFCHAFDFFFLRNHAFDIEKCIVNKCGNLCRHHAEPCLEYMIFCRLTVFFQFMMKKLLKKSALCSRKQGFVDHNSYNCKPCTCSLLKNYLI